MFTKKQKQDAQDIRNVSLEQYKELLEKNGISTDSPTGFILGEKKEIYSSSMSLEDIIEKHK